MVLKNFWKVFNFPEVSKLKDFQYQSEKEKSFMH
jgi:hypothetical protein